jgi:hypothetical protein
VFLTRGVEAPPPAEIRDVTAPASASAVEARFTRAVAAARIQSLRTVLTAAPRGERAEKPAGRPGLDRGELVRLAAARQWEALDPAAAAERYRGIARANPSGPAALVAESRLDVLAVHLKRPPDKHD